MNTNCMAKLAIGRRARYYHLLDNYFKPIPIFIWRTIPSNYLDKLVILFKEALLNWVYLSSSAGSHLGGGDGEGMEEGWGAGGRGYRTPVFIWYSPSCALNFLNKYLEETLWIFFFYIKLLYTFLNTTR